MHTFVVTYKKEEYDKAHELSNHCDQHSPCAITGRYSFS